MWATDDHENLTEQRGSLAFFLKNDILEPTAYYQKEIDSV
jgi:hypothetical protein